MPSRLRPTAPMAPDAILVGDPGRALLLAQELLTQPKMSNHARGLWGYSGETPAGRPLTIQATGMGGPSAALVLADLAQLGVRRAVRVGTCTGVEGAALGELLLVTAARPGGGHGASFGVAQGGAANPDAELTERLRTELGEAARPAEVASLDTHPPKAAHLPAGVAAADLQTLALFARATELGVAVAALLIVAEAGNCERLSDESLEAAAKSAGTASAGALG
jgi:uridine phosphorylase